MIQRTARQILKEMQECGWTQGEAELLPKYLESAIKQNSERIRNRTVKTDSPPAYENDDRGSHP